MLKRYYAVGFLLVLSISSCMLHEVPDGQSPYIKQLYTLFFDGNKHTGGTIPEHVAVVGGSAVTVPEPEDSFARVGFEFGGWNTKADASGNSYQPGDVFTMPTMNYVLYALWVVSHREVGDGGPAGGWVFYDKGSYSQGWRYLEAAPAYTQGIFKWWEDGIMLAGTASEIGTGRKNSENILMTYGFDESNSYAALFCHMLQVEFKGDVYDDWFLPSADELLVMHEALHLAGIGNFSKTDYWSSTEFICTKSGEENYLAFYISFFDSLGEKSSAQKHNTMRVRAIRSF